MIKVSGANVAPAEVERELLTIDGITAAHVVGVDDADRGQIVGAAVVLRAGALLQPGGHPTSAQRQAVQLQSA